MALTKTQVSELYVAIFNRASEGEGNNFWQGRDGSVAEIADAMLATAPAQAFFAGTDNEAFVQLIYQNTKGSVGDAEGVAFWTDRLDNGVSRGELVEQFIGSLNHSELEGEALENQKNFQNRVEVSNYVADTIVIPGAEIEDIDTLLGFNANLQGVTADAASIEAVKAKVDQVLNPVDPVIAALQEVQAARKAVDDFLFDAAQTDETPEEDEALIEGDLEAALKKAEGKLEANEYAITAKFDAENDSPALQESKLNTAKLAAAEVVADAQEAADKALDAAAKVPGLVSAMLAAQARGEELEAASKAAGLAQLDFNAAKGAYDANYSEVAPTVLDEDDKLIVNPEITNAAQKAEANKVLTAQVALTQANAAVTTAENAVIEAEWVVQFADADKGAKDKLFDLVTGNDPDDEDGNATEGRGDSLTYAQYEAALAVANGKLAAAQEADDAEAEALALVEDLEDAFDGFTGSSMPVTAFELIGARDKLEDAQEAEKELLDLIAERDEAQAQLNQLEELQAAVDAAEKALEDTGFEVIHLDEVAVAGTAGDDVFVLYGDDSSIYNFNAQGSDKLYVGGDFKLVTLGADQKITDERLGDSAELEIFIKQDGANTVLYVEEQTFAGNRADSNDLVEITLNGVTASDLVLEDGFLSIA